MTILRSLNPNKKNNSAGVEARSSTGQYVGKDFFRTMISPSVSCHGREVELVICVPVKQDRMDRREVIRNTWGSYGRYGGRPVDVSNSSVRRSSSILKDIRTSGAKGEIILLFFLGSSRLPGAKLLQEDIEKEARIHGDIYQADFIDTYENLTLKTISLLKFMSSECPNARYVAKIDDDMFVNIPLLLKELRNQTEYVKGRIARGELNVSLPAKDTVRKSDVPPFAYGVLYKKAIVIRDKTSKWFTPEHLYKPNFYPPYLSGTGYAMSGSAAVKLYEASLRIPLFWMEDIFITGMCALDANVTLIGDDRFSISRRKPFSGCIFRRQISGHEYTGAEIKTLFLQLHDNSIRCKLKSFGWF